VTAVDVRLDHLAIATGGQAAEAWAEPGADIAVKREIIRVIADINALLLISSC
jgi:hypothetical protein